MDSVWILPAFYAWFEPADRLFFKPVPGAIVRMKWYSVRYHFVRIFLLTAGLHLLCFPLHRIRFDQSSITVLLISLALSLLQPFFSFWTYRLSGNGSCGNGAVISSWQPDASPCYSCFGFNRTLSSSSLHCVCCCSDIFMSGTGHSVRTD